MSLPSAVISAASSGDNTIVAGVTGKRIVVLGYVLVGGGTVNATWKSSGGTALSGAMPLSSSTVVTAPVVPPGAGPAAVGYTEGWFATLAGEGLVLNLSGAVGVYGHVFYRVL